MSYNLYIIFFIPLFLRNSGLIELKFYMHLFGNKVQWTKKDGSVAYIIMQKLA